MQPLHDEMFPDFSPGMHHLSTLAVYSGEWPEVAVEALSTKTSTGPATARRVTLRHVLTSMAFVALFLHTL